jgi:sensor histidine kinase YesM
MNTSTRIFLIHFLGCLAFLSIPVFSSPDFGQGWNLLHINPFQKNFVRFVLLLGLFYASYYYFIPKLYFNNKKVLFAIAVLTSYSILIGLTEVIFGNRNDFPRHNSPAHFPEPPEHSEFFDSQMLIPFFLVIALAFLIKLNNRLIEIHDEKLNAEVSYLKAQINPHFLFNTLNSLYALTLQKSNEAPNAVLKLSGIMRYVVTESAQDYVSLDKELNYIKDYIDLQKLRIDTSFPLSFDINGDALGKIITPLILIPFIENAFKYGINPDENSFIKIQILIEGQTLQMTVKNAIVATEVSEELKTEEGLKNTIKRLNFIYPDKHTLKVTENDKTYEVNLKIELL